MNPTKILLAALLMLSLLPLTAQENPAFRIDSPHPRLMLRAGEEGALKNKIASNQFLGRAHASIMAQCEKYLGEPVLEKNMVGSAMLGTSRKAFMCIYYLSYAWRMTGERKYADRAIAEMVNVCSFDSWNPSHFLDVAEMTFGVSLGYDWLFDLIDEDTRAFLRAAVTSKGLNESVPDLATAPSHYSWLKKKNNWNPVCNLGMVAGAVITYDHNPEFSRGIIERAVRLVNGLAMHEYLPDGNYPEGYSYWSYGTGFTVMLIETLEKLYGTSFGIVDNKGFMATPYYMLHMGTQNLGCFAYSDCFLNRGLSLPMYWFAVRLGDQSVLWNEKQRLDFMDKNGYKMSDIFETRYLPSLILWASEDTFRDMQNPSERLYVGQGTSPVAIMRNHWGGRDEIFAGLKAGTGFTNHAHMDVGSFVMYKGANQWATDPGAQDYYSFEKFGITLGNRVQEALRWDMLRLSSRIHNLMTFNGRKQNVYAKAGIDSWGDSRGFVFATTDVTAPDSITICSHVRGVAIAGDSYVVVRDQVKNAGHLTDTRWAMFTPAHVEITSDSTATLTMNGDKLYMVAWGRDIKMRTWSTESEHAYDEALPGTVMIGFTTVMEPGEDAAFEVLLIPDDPAKAAGYTSKPLSDWK